MIFTTNPFILISLTRLLRCNYLAFLIYFFHAANGVGEVPSSDRTVGVGIVPYVGTRLDQPYFLCPLARFIWGMFGRLPGHRSHRTGIRQLACCSRMQIQVAARCLVSAACGSCSCDEAAMRWGCSERTLGAAVEQQDGDGAWLSSTEMGAAGAGGEMGGGGLRRRDGAGKRHAAEDVQQAGGRRRNGGPADRRLRGRENVDEERHESLQPKNGRSGRIPRPG